jgi:hypothetical protein
MRACAKGESMATPSFDPYKTVHINTSPLKMFFIVLGGLALTAASVWMTQLTEGSSRHSVEWLHFWGYVGAILFGGLSLLLIWRLLTQRGPTITLSPKGVLDTRVSKDLIPWRAIQSVGTWTYSGNSMLVLSLYPGEEDKLRLSRIAQWTRSANAALGADGLILNAQGTKISHDNLADAVHRYLAVHGRGASRRF